jgi:hypothetical protein
MRTSFAQELMAMMRALESDTALMSGGNSQGESFRLQFPMLTCVRDDGGSMSTGY